MMGRAPGIRLCALLLSGWLAEPILRSQEIPGELPAVSPWIGTSSCSASHCHGAPWESARKREDSGESWRTAYTVWSKFDPHAQAYTSLFNSRSVRILRRLEGREIDAPSGEYRRLLQEKCLDCHAAGDARRTEPHLALSGVSCESCHGAAADWGGTHYHTESSPAKPTPLQNLHERAQVCVRCHVGPGLDAAADCAEVNHELIAAGHPRLQFEFSAYLAALPPHWNVSADQAGRRERRHDFFAEAWSAGQHVTQQAVLGQLRRRIQSAATDAKATWPEFAEYDCFSCHHGLRDQSSRRRLSPSFGRWSWGAWTFASAPFVGNLSPELFSEFRQTLQRGGTTSTRNLTDLETAAAELHRQLSAPIPASQSWKMLVTYLSDAESTGFRHWEEAAQWSLAGQAAHRSLAWQLRNEQPAAAPLKELSDRLQIVRRQLAFDRPAKKAAVPNLVWESPSQFHPQSAEFIDRVQQIQVLIQNLDRQRPAQRE